MKRITAQQYAQILVGAYQTASPGRRPMVIKNFVGLLARHRAWKLIPRILRHVEQLEDKAAGQTRVDVWHATALRESALAAALKKSIGNVRIVTHQDAGLIGGLRLRVNDTLIDTSVASQLRQLQNHLSHV